MLDWLNKTKSSSNSGPVDRSAEVRVIGDRGSGKTAYMASLAYWPNANASSPVQTVTPVNDEANELISKAQNILEQGLKLEPTDLDAIVENVKDYTLSIILKESFSWKAPKVNLQPQLVKLNISCKDYAGEFFSDLLHKTGDSRLSDYLEDCVRATGIMFLVDGTTHRKDSEYANGIDKFLIALDRADIGSNQRRIAFVITKCEESELWVNRHQPQGLAKARFPKTCGKLQGWQQTGCGQIDYFTTSAFGMLGQRYPEPNSKRLNRDRDGTTSVIKDPKHWRPFGLVAPIYWLCTGERHKELDKD